MEDMTLRLVKPQGILGTVCYAGRHTHNKRSTSHSGVRMLMSALQYKRYAMLTSACNVTASFATKSPGCLSVYLHVPLLQRGTTACKDSPPHSWCIVVCYQSHPGLPKIAWPNWLCTAVPLQLTNKDSPPHSCPLELNTAHTRRSCCSQMPAASKGSMPEASSVKLAGDRRKLCPNASPT